jgi:hypothetical protein
MDFIIPTLSLDGFDVEAHDESMSLASSGSQSASSYDSFDIDELFKDTRVRKHVTRGLPVDMKLIVENVALNGLDSPAMPRETAVGTPVPPKLSAFGSGGAPARQLHRFAPISLHFTFESPMECTAVPEVSPEKSDNSDAWTVPGRPRAVSDIPDVLYSPEKPEFDAKLCRKRSQSDSFVCGTKKTKESGVEEKEFSDLLADVVFPPLGQRGLPLFQPSCGSHSASPQAKIASVIHYISAVVQPTLDQMVAVVDELHGVEGGDDHHELRTAIRHALQYVRSDMKYVRRRIAWLMLQDLISLEHVQAAAAVDNVRGHAGVMQDKPLRVWVVRHLLHVPDEEIPSKSVCENRLGNSSFSARIMRAVVSYYTDNAPLSFRFPVA